MKDFLTRVLQHDMVRRAFHTFWQTFLVVWLSTGLMVDKVSLIAAGAAGLSAVKTLVLDYLKGRRA